MPITTLEALEAYLDSQKFHYKSAEELTGGLTNFVRAHIRLDISIEC